MGGRVLAISLACCMSAFGWGADGHTVVGRIAETHLTPAAKERVRELIGERSLGDNGVASWADLIRGSAELRRKYKNNDRWHYINFDIATKLEAAVPTASGDDVIGAVEKFMKVVVDPAVDKDDRKEALFFLVHFVGDLHQPLHSCARNDDRGGNLQLVKYHKDKDAKLNLHRVWDSHILKAEMAGLTTDDFAKRTGEAITKEQLAAWQKGNVRDWVKDSHAVGAKTVYQLTDGTALPARDQPAIELTDDNYINTNRPVVREQLQKGGVRLALLLNELFAEKK